MQCVISYNVVSFFFTFKVDILKQYYNHVHCLENKNTRPSEFTFNKIYLVVGTIMIYYVLFKGKLFSYCSYCILSEFYCILILK